MKDLQAERALIGAILLTPRWRDNADVRPEHFSAHEHAALWAEITDRYRAGRLADAVSLREWAETHLKELGGQAYLLGLMEGGACVSAQVSEYALIIRNLARRRAVEAVAQQAIAEAKTGEGDALTSLEQRLQEIAANDADADVWTTFGVNTIHAVERATLGETAGISTGFQKLDAATGGLQPGTLWVIGGATSMGKSVFGAALSRNVAAQGYGVGETHLEMDAIQIGLRTATALAFDKSHKADNPYYLSAQRGALTRQQWDTLHGAAKAAAALPIYMDARPGRTLSQIEAAARRLFRKMEREGVKPGALLIDHEGLIAPEPGTRTVSQLEATNARANGLLTMAKRLGVAVVALSQITKEGSRADGEDRLPTSQDLNYGSALSQAASVVILLHRKAYYAERKPSHLRSEEDLFAIRSRQTTLVVDKARGGQRQQVQVMMDMPTAAVWEEAG